LGLGMPIPDMFFNGVVWNFVCEEGLLPKVF